MTARPVFPETTIPDHDLDQAADLEVDRIRYRLGQVLDEIDRWEPRPCPETFTF